MIGGNSPSPDTSVGLGGPGPDASQDEAGKGQSSGQDIERALLCDQWCARMASSPDRNIRALRFSNNQAYDKTNLPHEAIGHLIPPPPSRMPLKANPGPSATSRYLGTAGHKRCCCFSTLQVPGIEPPLDLDLRTYSLRACRYPQAFCQSVPLSCNGTAQLQPIVVFHTILQ